LGGHVVPEGPLADVVSEAQESGYQPVLLLHLELASRGAPAGALTYSSVSRWCVKLPDVERELHAEHVLAGAKRCEDLETLSVLSRDPGDPVPVEAHVGREYPIEVCDPVGEVRVLRLHAVGGNLDQQALRDRTPDAGSCERMFRR
jgi:hypothetical protein